MSGYEPGREWAPGTTWAPPAPDTQWGYWPPPAPPPPPPRRSGGARAVLAILTALLVGAAAVFAAGLLTWPSLRHGFASSPGSAPGVDGAGQAQPAGDGSISTGAVEAKVDPAVVAIDSTFGYQRASGAGTGIVLTADGEVLTNNHVINGATRIEATDQGNGRTYTATVLGYDSSHDLALLKLQGASGLSTASLGDSSRLTVGQPVVAIGNAGGTGSPVSAAGSITALDQAITASDSMNGTAEQLSGLIEVNANVQPGDSGGPLADASGRVIGVDTAASAGMTFQGAGGQGYAIPISQAVATAHQIESGQASDTVHVGATAFLGVLLGGGGHGDDPNGDGQQGFGAPAAGATIAGVVSGGTAEQAGLVAGDVITSLNGRTIDSATTLSAVVSTLHPGDRVQLGWVDATGVSHSVTVSMAAGPPA